MRLRSCPPARVSNEGTLPAIVIIKCISNRSHCRAGLLFTCHWYHICCHGETPRICWMIFKSLRYRNVMEFRTVVCLNTTGFVRLKEFYYIACPKTKYSLLYTRQFMRQSLWNLGLQFLDCCLESRWGHRCSSIVFVVCCVGSGFYDELITRPEASYRMFVCLCVCVCVCVCVCLVVCNL